MWPNKGKHKSKQKSVTSTAAATTAPWCKQNGGAPNNTTVGQSSTSVFIVDAFSFVIASEKKLTAFPDEETARSGSGASAVTCKVGTVTGLVGGATCGTCGMRKLAVAKVEGATYAAGGF